MGAGFICRYGFLLYKTSACKWPLRVPTAEGRENLEIAIFNFEIRVGQEAPTCSSNDRDRSRLR